VLVVDNSASQFYEQELADMIERQVQTLGFSLQLLNSNCNLGFARGVNFALQSADCRSCDAILLINNDAVAFPGMVSGLAEALGRTKAQVVAPTVVDEDAIRQPVLWYQRYSGLQTKRKLPGSFPYLSGCCLLVHRDAFSGHGLFDEDFFMYGEDTCLGWGLARSREIPHCLPDVFVRHENRGSSRQGQLFYEYHSARAHVLLAKKTWYYALEIPALLVCKGIFLSIRACWRSVRFGTIVPLKASLMAWSRHDIQMP